MAEPSRSRQTSSAARAANHANAVTAQEAAVTQTDITKRAAFHRPFQPHPPGCGFDSYQYLTLLINSANYW